ncbi:Hypp7149 [Branchiostoma lanceolatum]|uniref:Hypp7149 protein n=1 Tax=Branchiostoma lanceolatum TaxID=7740 RepID=A0A8J9YY24_BRALA|nr:Hypp7149 [Branchiostoma lanceolatum]
MANLQQGDRRVLTHSAELEEVISTLQQLHFNKIPQSGAVRTPTEATSQANAKHSQDQIQNNDTKPVQPLKRVRFVRSKRK